MPSAPSGNDSSSDLSSLIAAEVSRILGISSTPSASLVSSTGLSLMTSSDTLTKWILDSGASHHMTPHISLLHNTFPPSSPTNIQVANGSYAPLKCIGTVSQPTWTISDVYHVPNLSVNLLSIGKLTDIGLTVTFSSDHCFVQDCTSKKQIGIGHREGGLYLLDSLHLPATQSTATLSYESPLQNLMSRSSLFHLWHSRLGHVSSSRLQFMIRKKMLNSSIKTERTQLSARSSLCVFIGYWAKGIPKSSPMYDKTELIHIDPFTADEPDDDVSSNTSDFNSRPPIIRQYSRRTLQQSASDAPPSDGSISTDSLDVADPVPTTPRYPTRIRQAPNRYSPPSNFYSTSYVTFLTNIHSLVEPKSYKDAILDPNWRLAIEEELTALQKTDTWELISLPAPAFIFVDEIDAIAGRQAIKDPRRRTTFEALIAQLDGEKEKTGIDRFSLRQAVIFICATNRPDELDLEFVRTGRIDRHLYIGLPDAKQRVQIVNCTEYLSL
ncbi:hypothetical protein EZV62_006260 [Acer yangbiense]|uniref:ATPase AAA-type core domain-containing protein n=1 Tax=Acer yangbiense TaxID=1000413 RepID=A0A5C7IQ01_9ROSI|nr:hypothetical protein EZV62_006260 [Acer yangbiense]